MDSMSEAFDQMQMVKDVLANSDKVSEVLKSLLISSTCLLHPLSYQREARHAGALQRPTTSIMFGDATSKSPLGVFKNYHLKIGECIIQTDLTVMEMEEEKDLPLLLGTPFLSTVGASIDFHKQEVILHKVVKERLTKNQELGRIRMREDQGLRSHVLRGLELRNHVLRPRADRLVQAPCVLDEESLQALFDEPLGRALKEGEDVASKARPGDKRKDPPAQAPSVKPSQLTMTLFPTKFENGKIEYKIRYKGRSRPFSRAKALVTSEQSRDPTKLKELLSQVLTITLDGGMMSFFGAWKDLVHGRSSTGYAKEEGGSHLEDQLDHLLDHRSSSSTRPAKLQLDRAEKSKSNPKNVASPLTFFDPKPKSSCI
ncbi:unnamed protein product [Microthlaspi erraticum]|uniref:Aspartic peptidase DDI1-type domain-containing protein n=1 Tax=Microthlaspi erraticum TaxID=1685480 RepID=A0A6D2JY48_9BRAS|nr:unnamed protein product [Microthlaspi erraticum]